jgi:hypothetical protein
VPDPSSTQENFDLSEYASFHYEVITQTAELEALGPEWNHILEHSAIRVPFLQYEYLSTWCRAVCGDRSPLG